MSVALLLAAVWLGQPAPPAPPPELLAWAHVPDGAALRERLAASSWRPLAPLWGKAEGPGALSVRWLVAGTDVRLDVWRASQNKTSDPLATELAAAATSEPADLRAHLDVQRFYGWLARGPRGSRWAQAVRRLGLDQATHLSAAARLLDGRSVRSTATLHLPRSSRGLPGALGPPVAPEWPAEVPKNTLGFASISLVPASLWAVLETVAAGERPIEYGLARVQLDALEQQLGKRMLEDALGTTPRRWTLYQLLAKKGGVETVLVAPMQDVSVAERLVAGMVEVLQGMQPALQVQRDKVQKHSLLSLRHVGELHFLFRKDALVLATSRAALDAHLAHKGRAAPLEGAAKSAVAWGAHNDAMAARGLFELAKGAGGRPGPLQPAVAHVGAAGLDRSAVLGSLGRSTWTVMSASDGLALEMVSRAAK